MPDGNFEIEGEFSPEEVDVILEVGLNMLYQTGALPFKKLKKSELGKFQPYSESKN